MKRHTQSVLSVVGRTVDGKRVVAGTYRFFETFGLPLEVVFQSLEERNAIPCWISFYRDARDGGMGHDRILSKLDPAISDSYGAETRTQVLAGLEALHGAGRI